MTRFAGAGFPSYCSEIRSPVSDRLARADLDADAEVVRDRVQTGGTRLRIHSRPSTSGVS